MVPDWEKTASFWADDDGSSLVVLAPDLEGSIVEVEGFRFKYTRNELGHLYRRSLGQIGYHLAPTCTIQQYAAQARAMAEAHAASLSPEILAAIGPTMTQVQLGMTPAPVPADMQSETLAVFL